MADIIKTCGACGRRLTAADWKALPLIGVIDDRRKHSDGERMEMRNCSCGSTLGLVTDRAPVPLVYTGPLAGLGAWLAAHVLALLFLLAACCAAPTALSCRDRLWPEADRCVSACQTAGCSQRCADAWMAALAECKAVR